MKKNCKICNSEFNSVSNRHYCKKCLPSEGLNSSQRKTLLRKIFKEKLLELKGNKCSKCGYSKCKEALEFHHLDPNKKKFSISKYESSKWEDYVKEAEKCILICANCHREIHVKN